MDQKSIRIFVVDAFTSEVFSGNPAAVCLLQNDLPDHLKLKIAAEMNLTETVFVALNSEKGDESFENSTMFRIRWFTPECEVPLCGHATLAAAAVIFDKYGNKSKTIEFQTSSGIFLRASRDETSSITLDFPLNAPSPYEAGNRQQIIKIAVGDFEVLDVQLSTSTKYLVIRLADKYSRKDLESLSPSTQEMLSVEDGSTFENIVVTVRGNLESEGYDFYSRCFAPWVGLPEDPVCGSAHTVLAPLWKAINGKSEFKARQCSKRGGDLTVRIINDRAELGGKVAHVLEGTMCIQ